MQMLKLVMSDYSKSHMLHVAEVACSSPAMFKQLVKCFVSTDMELSKRAAWSLGWAAKQCPALVYPHLKDIIAMLDAPGRHPAILRNAVRVLEELEIPEDYEGLVMDACFRLVATPNVAPAVKAFSLTVLHRLAMRYPEIKHELQLVIEENFDNESPAFRSRGRKILKALSGKKSTQ